jgi:23S rRNA pseudouridine1911/1915/1917 synthase
LEAIEAFEALLLEQERLIEDEDLDDNDDIGGQLQQRPLSSVVDVRTYTVPAELHKKRIDAAIATLIENETTAAASDVYSRSFCGNLVTDGRVTVDQQIVARKSYKVEVGQQLQVQLLLSNGGETVTEIIAQDLPLNILFEDAHMIVLNKAAGMVVHPAAGNWDGTVVNALAYYLRHTSPYSSSSGNDDFFVKNRENNGNESVDDTNDCATDSNNDNSFDSFRPGIVHRLDKGTTGVLVVAKTPTALAALSEQFATRQVKKTYLAVTVGNPGKRVVIDKPIGRHPVYRQRMRVVPDPHQKDSSGMTPADRKQMRENNDSLSTLSQSGRRALSLVDTIAFDGKLALVQVRIETGRTHQIRVHLQDRHTPIYGDDIYGLADWNKRLNKTHAVERPLLHAYKLQLQHPVTGETMLFQAPLADDMRKIAKTIYPQGDEEMPEVFFTAKDGSE